MNALWIMIPVTLALVVAFIWSFVWAARGGQFDDLVTPAHRALLDENDLNDIKSTQESAKGFTS